MKYRKQFDEYRKWNEFQPSDQEACEVTIKAMLRVVYYSDVNGPYHKFF